MSDTTRADTDERVNGYNVSERAEILKEGLDALRSGQDALDCVNHDLAPELAWIIGRVEKDRKLWLEQLRENGERE